MKRLGVCWPSRFGLRPVIYEQHDSPRDHHGHRKRIERPFAQVGPMAGAESGRLGRESIDGRHSRPVSVVQQRLAKVVMHFVKAMKAT